MGDLIEEMNVEIMCNSIAKDISAFYDRPLESVNKEIVKYLNSDFYNNLYLGISSNEKIRDEKSKELYGKSFDILNEYQKKITLLKQLEDSNKISGAFGQYEREYNI